MRFLLIFCAVGFCIGLWRHDWKSIIVNCLLALLWLLIRRDVYNERELDRLWDDDEDLSGSA